MPLDPALKRLIDRAYKAGHADLHTLSHDAVLMHLARFERVSKCALPEEHNPEEGVHFYLQRSPSPSRGTIFFIRGSAFTGGSLDTHDYCLYLAESLQMDVITLLFRVAPQYRFPIYYEDCARTLQWLVSHQETLNLQGPFLLWGESSGGTIAASLSHAFGTKLIDQQVLIYPMLDLIHDYPSKQQYGQGYMLDLPFIEWLKSHTLNDPAEASDFRASPLLASLHASMPRTLILTAEYDPLRDEGEAYARQISQAGNQVALRRQDGVIHGFLRYYDKLQGAQESLQWVFSSLLFGSSEVVVEDIPTFHTTL